MHIYYIGKTDGIHRLFQFYKWNRRRYIIGVNNIDSNYQYKTTHNSELTGGEIMAIFNRIFGRNTIKNEVKEFRAYQADAAVKEYVENQRIAAADTRILL